MDCSPPGFSVHGIFQARVLGTNKLWDSRLDFPAGSDGKASAYNAGDPGSTLGWEDLLEKKMATHSSILAWKIPWTEEPVGYSPWGHKELDMTERLHFKLWDWPIPRKIRCMTAIHLIRKGISYVLSHGLPRWCSGKESACQCKRCRFDPWIRKIPWSRKWQLALVFLSGKFHGQKSLASYSPWGRKKSDMTEHTHTHTC